MINIWIKKNDKWIKKNNKDDYYKKLLDKLYSLNAIVVLTRGYNNKTDYKDLIKRNNSLSQQKWWYKYDYIIFHEGKRCRVEPFTYIRNEKHMFFFRKRVAP